MHSVPRKLRISPNLEKSTHREVLMALKEAGLDSLPGPGAEILTDQG